MDTPPATKNYKNHRFPVEIISHAVWLYCRFCLSLREVEEILCERGVVVTSEAIRHWCGKFGQQYANQLRRRRPRPGDKWHLDEIGPTIKGERHYLWRAVDQEGNVLDILVQRRRDKRAAKKFFRKLLKGLAYVPRVIVTDKLKSYGAAKREILPGVEHRQHQYLNNRAENSHQPTRQRERRMLTTPSQFHLLVSLFPLHRSVVNLYAGRRGPASVLNYRPFSAPLRPCAGVWPAALPLLSTRTAGSATIEQTWRTLWGGGQRVSVNAAPPASREESWNIGRPLKDCVPV